jgi:hypothetical protein
MLLMKRLSLTVSGVVLDEPHRAANSRRVSIAMIGSEVLEEKAARSRPTPKSIGIAASGHSDATRASAEEPIVPRSFR